MTQQTGAATLTEVVLPGIVEPDGLLVRHGAVPAPSRGEVLVTVLATGVSYGEIGMRRGRYPFQPAFPFVPGYDLVGDVTAVGEGVDPALLGRRVAAVTKTGGWATHAVLDARTVVAVPTDLDPAAVETVLLNGITAWQLLHRAAGVRPGQVVLVHGVNGGVAHLLAQLAVHHGVRVVGTASPRHHDTLRAVGVECVDYHDPALADRLRGLVPEGYDAVFDHLGGDSFTRSFALLRRGGTLVGYGNAADLDGDTGTLATLARVLGRFGRWTLQPNGRSATFYNFWGGRLVRLARFRRRLAADLTSVLDLLRSGAVSARVGVRLPLEDAARAMTLAESGTVSGKVVLLPQGPA